MHRKCDYSCKDLLETYKREKNLSPFVFWFVKKCCIWNNSHLTKKFFRTDKEVYEAIEHHLTRPTVMHPFSEFVIWRKVVLIIVIPIILYIQPLCTTFYFDTIGTHKVLYPLFITIIDVILFLDVLVTFNIGLYNYDTREIILERKEIMKYNLLNWRVWLKLFICIPWDLLAHSLCPDTHDGKTDSLILHLIALISIVHIFFLFSKLETVCEIYFRNWAVFIPIKNIILTCLVLHWSTLLNLLVPFISRHCFYFGEWNNNSWPVIWKSENVTSKYELYSLSLFRTTSQLIGTDHAPPFPIEAMEDMFMAIITYIGGYAYCSYLSMVIFYHLNLFRTTEMKYYEVVNQVEAFSDYNLFPRIFRDKLVSYYEYKYQKNYFKEEKILETIPNTLKTEINYYASMRLIEKVPILTEFPEEVASKIMAAITIDVYLPNDIILQAEAPADCMFFIGSGTVAVYTRSGKEMCHLAEGTYFGEVGLMLRDTRNANVVALDLCELYRLPKYEFEKYILSDEDQFRKFFQKAYQRCSDTYNVEEKHRTYVTEYFTPWVEK